MIRSRAAQTPRRKRRISVRAAAVIGLLVVIAIAAAVIAIAGLATSNTRGRAIGRHAASPPRRTQVAAAHVRRSGDLRRRHRWYASSSLWNTPIAAHPRIASNNASLIAAWANTGPCRGLPCLNPSGVAWTPAIYYASRVTRKVPVRIDVRHCNAYTVHVPIPVGALPDPSHEGHMAVAAANGTEYDFYGAQSPGGQPKSSRYYAKSCSTVNEWTAAKVVTTNWIRGNGELRGATRGSGTPEGAGTILPQDTQSPPAGNWGHALAISYRNTCSHTLRWCSIVAPATEEDGTGRNPATDVPEGARFQLDPSINCNTWPSLKYVWQRQMCRTLEVYGAIVVDTNYGGMGIAVQWAGSTNGYAYPWAPHYPGLPNDLLAHFRVLAWR